MFNFFFDLKNLGREKEVRKGEYPQFTKSISRIREVTSRNRYYHLCLPDEEKRNINKYPGPRLKDQILMFQFSSNYPVNSVFF